MRYQEQIEENPDAKDDRPRREFNKVTVQKLDGKRYMFAGGVFDLSRGGERLSEEEVSQLPIKAYYMGPEVDYKTDEKAAFEILSRILSNGNKMQDKDFYSFALGNLFHPIQLGPFK